MTPSQMIAAITAGIAALVTAITALIKLGPDRAKAWVGTADELVKLADDRVTRMAQEIEIMEARLTASDQRMDRFRDDLTNKNEEIDRLRSIIYEERRQHQNEVHALTSRVELLEHYLEIHNIPLPDHPEDT